VLQLLEKEAPVKQIRALDLLLNIQFNNAETT
jgi:hypothetical protein